MATLHGMGERDCCQMAPCMKVCQEALPAVVGVLRGADLGFNPWVEAYDMTQHFGMHMCIGSVPLRALP